MKNTPTQGGNVTDGAGWEPLVADEGRCYFWHLKNTLLYIYRQGDAWFIHVEERPEAEEKWQIGRPLDGCPDLEWTRYIVGKEDRLQLLPVVADRPMILKPTTPVKLLPGKSVTFYIEIPLWVKLVSKGDRNQSSIFDIPITSFSHIWFGDPGEGELCYSCAVELLMEPTDLRRLPYVAVATVHIKNCSALQLDLQKILLHTDYLYLFEHEEMIWSDEITYQFRGVEQSSQISFSKKPPDLVKQARHISGPRIPAVQGLIKRSFGILKYFTGF